MTGTLIVGAGQAGLQVAMSLRSLGYDSEITLVGDEAHLPYQRPPLSKGFVSGSVPLDGLWLQPTHFYGDNCITLLRSDPAVDVCAERNLVRLSSGRELRYENLVLATGAAPRCFPGPGGDSDEVLSVRTLEDSARLRSALYESQRIVVIGGGFIGLEVSALARGFGVAVTVVEASDRLMGRAVSNEISQFALEAHTRRGVDFRLQVGVVEICPASDGGGVLLESGERIPADAVVSGIGANPRVDLARRLGADIDRGVLVDEWARTSVPGVFAIGDCAQHRNLAGHSLTLESVHNAIEQGKVVARAIVGDVEDYQVPVPWFWSDQGDLKIQMLGLPVAHDEIVTRGDVGSESFALLYLQDARLVRAEMVNRPADLAPCREAISQGRAIDVAVARDIELPLRRMLLPSP